MSTGMCRGTSQKSRALPFQVRPISIRGIYFDLKQLPSALSESQTKPGIPKQLGGGVITQQSVVSGRNVFPRGDPRPSQANDACGMARPSVARTHTSWRRASAGDSISRKSFSRNSTIPRLALATRRCITRRRQAGATAIPNRYAGKTTFEGVSPSAPETVNLFNQFFVCFDAA